VAKGLREISNDRQKVGEIKKRRYNGHMRMFATGRNGEIQRYGIEIPVVREIAISKEELPSIN